MISDWSDHVQMGGFLVGLALEEDAVGCDAATEALGDAGSRTGTVSAVARQELTMCGWFLVEAVYRTLTGTYGLPPVRTEQLLQDGSSAGAGAVLGRLTGPVDPLLRGERVALNMLARMSGIATLTGSYVEAVKGTGVEILDTRKTTPCQRALERYAVRTGGGVNHRFDLAEMAMIKDNHIAAAGGVEALPAMVAVLKDSGVPVQIEVDSLGQLEQILPLHPDRILLDNMDVGMLKRSVAMASGSGCYLEASGGVTLESVTEIACTGVDGISSGALTHSASWADIGFDWRTE